MGNGRLGLAARLLRDGNPQQRRAALPLLAGSAARRPELDPGLRRLLVTHAPELVRTAVDLRDGSPGLGRDALKALSDVLSQFDVAAELTTQLPDLLGLESLRLTLAKQRLEASGASQRPPAALNVALLERAVGRGEQALKRARESVDALRALERDPPNGQLAEALNVLAIVEHEAGEHRRALVAAHESVNLHAQAWLGHRRQRISTAWSCLTLGVCYRTAQQPDLARRYMDEAIRLGAADHDPVGEQPQPLVGAVVTRVTHFPTADVNADLRALSVNARRFDDRAQLASARGWVLAAADHHERAVSHLQEAVMLRRAELDAAAEKPTRDLAQALEALAASLSSTARPLAAARATTEALMLWGRHRSAAAAKRRAVRYLCRAVGAETPHGDLALAETLYREAMELVDDEDLVGKAMALSSGAILAFDQQDQRQAVERAQGSVTIAEAAVTAGQATDEQTRFARLTLRLVTNRHANVTT